MARNREGALELIDWKRVGPQAYEVVLVKGGIPPLFIRAHEIEFGGYNVRLMDRWWIENKEGITLFWDPDAITDGLPSRKAALLWAAWALIRAEEQRTGKKLL